MADDILRIERALRREPDVDIHGGQQPTRAIRCIGSQTFQLGTSVPSGAQRFRITLATIGGVRTTLTPLQDNFAPAQFTAMSDDQKLSAPSFQAMTSGAALGADGYATGAPVTVAVVYEQALVTADTITPPAHQRLPLPPDVFATLTATTSAPVAAFALRDAA